MASVVNSVLQSIILLDKLKQSLIEVNVTVLEADGCIRCACINAAVLACVDAGIPIRGFVTAATACYRDDHVLLGLD